MRCKSGRHLGERPHRSSPDRADRQTYAEKACVDERLERAILSKTCLVYGVGVAQDWSFERALAAEGCEVHLFDPTVSHASRPDPRFRNISFHKWGLDHPAAAEYNASVAARRFGYGLTQGELLPLEAILVRLGHLERRISVLKVDCEGCEWAALGTLPQHVWDRVDQLVVELHMSTAYSFASRAAVSRAATLVEQLSAADFHLWYSEPNLGGWPGTSLRKIWPPLLAAGYPSSEGCCVQQGWIRRGRERITPSAWSHEKRDAVAANVHITRNSGRTAGAR